MKARTSSAPFLDKMSLTSDVVQVEENVPVKTHTKFFTSVPEAQLLSSSGIKYLQGCLQSREQNKSHLNRLMFSPVWSPQEVKTTNVNIKVIYLKNMYLAS